MIGCCQPVEGCVSTITSIVLIAYLNMLSVCCLETAVCRDIQSSYVNVNLNNATFLCVYIIVTPQRRMAFP